MYVLSLQMLLFNNKFLLTIKQSLYLTLLSFACLHLPLMAADFSVIEITAEPLIETLSRTGKVKFKRTLDLSFKSNGYLEKLKVDEGDYFVKGQLLAQLDETELIAEKNSSYARLLQAKREVERIKTLINNKLSSQQALDDAQTLVQIRRANFELAEYKLAKTKIIAPYDGVVVNRYASLGELQTPNKNTIKIAALVNNVVVNIGVTADEIHYIDLQQQAIVNLGRFGEASAFVSKIPARADPMSHLFNVEFLLSDVTLDDISIGGLAEVTAQITTKILVYKLPLKALNGVNKSGKAIVMIFNKDTTTSVPVTHKFFDIEKVSNQFVFLSAEQGATPLRVIDEGWQKLQHKLHQPN